MVLQIVECQTFRLMVTSQMDSLTGSGTMLVLEMVMCQMVTSLMVVYSRMAQPQVVLEPQMVAQS